MATHQEQHSEMECERRSEIECERECDLATHKRHELDEYYSMLRKDAGARVVQRRTLADHLDSTPTGVEMFAVCVDGTPKFVFKDKENATRFCEEYVREGLALNPYNPKRTVVCGEDGAKIVRRGWLLFNWTTEVELDLAIKSVTFL